jgi:hypothetical protein
MKYILLLLSLTGAVSSVGASEATAMNPWLVDVWRDVDSGTTLEITSGGQFTIVAPGGNVLESGTVRCVALDHVDWFPGSYSAALVLRFRHEEREWPVSAYWYPGEGDPRGLDLFVSRIVPGWLFDPFGVTREEGRLSLRGSTP